MNPIHTRYSDVTFHSIKNIVLDIDQTLLHAIEKEYILEEWKTEFQTYEEKDYIFFLRPNLKEFLQFISTHFEFGIFTSACKDYAETVVKHIIKPLCDKTPAFVFSLGDTNECQIKTGGIKTLQFIEMKYPSFQKENTLIIDDLITVKQLNKERCMMIPPFYICREINNKSSIYRKSLQKDERKKRMVLEGNFITNSTQDKELEVIQMVLRHQN